MRRARGWRPALRIARREALRARGRTALVAVMIFLPVVAVTAIAVLVRTNDVSPVEALGRDLGAADARVRPYGRAPVAQAPEHLGSFSGDPELAEGDDTRPWTAAEIAALTGGRVLPLSGGSGTVRTDRGRLRVIIREVDVADPATKGMVDIGSGRAPVGDAEVLVSPELAERGFRPGAVLPLEAGSANTPRVVGVARVLGVAGAVVVGRPGALLAPTWKRDYLIAGTGPVSWAEVRELNARGLAVLSRAVVLDPPAPADVPEQARFSDGTNAAERLVLAIVVTSIVVEVVLLAGPAFAVGARRSRRELALIAAAGADRAHVRRVVLAGALVIGFGAALLGAGAGVVVARLAIPVAQRFGAEMSGPFDVAITDLAAVVVVAGAAALLAALAPARSAARQDVVAALAGRRGTVRTRAGWPVLGLALAAAGAAVALVLGTRQGGEFTVVGGTVLLVAGAIALTPTLVGLLGRLAGPLPLPLRLAARDAARNRGRTAPAVAAVMAAVAGITALAIGSASDFEQRRIQYVPQAAEGALLVRVGAGSAAAAEEVVRRTRSAVGGRPVLTVYQVVVAGGGEASGEAPSGGDGKPAPPTGGPGVIACPVSGQQTCSGLESTLLLGRMPLSAAQYAYDPPLVANSRSVEALTGQALSTTARRVLDNGGVLVADRRAIASDGTARIATYRLESRTGAGPVPRDVRIRAVPAAGLPRTGGPDTMEAPATLVVGEQLARDLELRWAPSVLVVPAGDRGSLTSGAEARLAEVVAGLDPDSSVYVERGFTETFTLPMAVLGIAGAVLVLAGTLTAAGLALADARPDLATLAAVGAAPRTRRLIAGGQAAVIGLLGAVLGLGVGAVPGVAVTFPLTQEGFGATVTTGPIIVVPWLLLSLVAIVVPLVASAAAAIGTRSRLPMVRRLGQ